MPEPEKARPAVTRQLKPASQHSGQTIHRPRLKSEVDIESVLSPPDTLHIRMADVAQPFLDPRSMQQS
ncbi:hypothetical protein FLONG3_5933 [Fusarium longipes]|uniref:Uncharacterized protein n=1 Tax=Fusarium longipes TaxID=694270 RepID=A0A395SS16_9HYPO|nr:hypothetical protein FLONG3_5933 [Fusarium longipes]